MEEIGLEAIRSTRVNNGDHALFCKEMIQARNISMSDPVSKHQTVSMNLQICSRAELVKETWCSTQEHDATS